MTAIAALAIVGCDAFSESSELEDLRARLETLEQAQIDSAKQEKRLEDLETSVEQQRRLTDALLAAIQAGGSPNTPTTSTGGLDPELKRRVDKLGVEVLEQVAKDENTKKAMRSMGELANEYLKKEVERAKRSP